MKRYTTLIFAFTFILLGQSFAHGQKQAERFIPIGQSPGLSGKVTRIGTVESVNAGAHTFVLAVDSDRLTVSFTDQTRIWLDRSKKKETALTGKAGDLQAGRRVEVKFVDPKSPKQAEWIKIEVP